MDIVVTNLIITLLLGVIAIGTTYAILQINKLKNKLSVEAEKVTDENTKILLLKALDNIDGLVLKQIDELSDSLVEELNMVKADGKVPTIDDVKDIVEKIKDKTLESLELSTIDILQKETVDIEEYVSNIVSDVIEDSFIN